MSATRISGELEHRAVEHGNLSVKPDLTDKDKEHEEWTNVDHRRGKNKDASDVTCCGPNDKKEGQKVDERGDKKEETTIPQEAKEFATLSSRKLKKLYNRVIPEGSAHVYGRNFDRNNAGKRVNNIMGHMGVSVFLEGKGKFLIRDVPDIGIVITLVPLSRDFKELAPLAVVGEKKIGDLMKVIKEAQQFNFFNLNREFGDTGNCIATVGAAKYFLQSCDQGVSIPYNINEVECKQAFYEVLVDQLHRFPELQEFMRSDEQGMQALMEELNANPQFKELNILIHPDQPKQHQIQQNQNQNQNQNQRKVNDININYPLYKEIDNLAKGYTSSIGQQPPYGEIQQPQQEHLRQHQQEQQ